MSEAAEQAEAPESAEEADLVARLERIAAFARRTLSVEIGASPSSRGRLGFGTLFREHRRYDVGDDPRSIDWNAYARLDEVFVRIFEPEDSAPVRVVLDASGSMFTEGGAKAKQASHLAAAFAAIGILVFAGAAIVVTPGGEEATFRGKGSLRAMVRFLLGRSTAAPGSYSLVDAVRRLGAKGERGPLVIVTDGVPPDELERALAIRGTRAALALHVVDPGELEPPVGGLSRYRDPESGRSRVLLVSRGLARRYADLMRSRLREVEAAAVRARAAFLRVSTRVAFDAAVLEVLSRRRPAAVKRT